MNQIKKEWALITGASSGFGMDYAHLLANQGMNLVITARREERLDELKETIVKAYGVEVEVITGDLSSPQAPLELYNSIKGKNIEINCLINNAGFGTFGEFNSTDWEKSHGMLMVNIISLTQLTKLFSDDMKTRGSGHILLVASVGAYQPCPTYSVYAATKSYVLNFGEALNFELKSSGVKVSVLSPGMTATEFLQASGQDATIYQRALMMKSRPVAQIGLKSMYSGIPSVVPGKINKLMVWSLRMIPRTLQTFFANQIMKGH